METVRQRIGILAVVLCCAVAGPSAGQMSKTPPPDKVPADFPQDCPILPKSIIRDYQSAIRNRVRVGSILVLETTATKEALTEFYKKELPANGWTVLKHPKNEGDLLEASKGKDRLLVGIVASHEGANPSITFRIAALGKAYGSGRP